MFHHVQELLTFQEYHKQSPAHPPLQPLPQNAHIIQLDRSNYKEKISLLIEDATIAIENISEKIDLAFIDADKVNYTKYYDMLFPKLKIGGLIVADNVLWSGKVTEDVSDNETQSIKNFNTKVKNDERVENLIVGIRDGIMVCQKIKD